MGAITIAIDGPAASGKSTVAGILAARLGYLYFDTGVMYRAVTWAALQRGTPIADEEAVTRLAQALRIEVTRPTVGDGRQYTVYADGHDVTWAIREPEVNRCVSPVSAYRGVRRALTPKQRQIGAGGGVVMVGRDIGTVVLPQAQVKIYLDATLEERARRRFAEEVQRNPAAEYVRVMQNLRDRDRIDSTRNDAPLAVASEALVIDSTNLSVAEVVARVEEAIRARLAEQAAGLEHARPGD